MTVTHASIPIAMRAALVPATPPPRITTLAAGTPGTPPEQNTDPALLLFQAMGADLHRHPAGDLAHRRQQRQAAARVGHGLVGDRDRTRPPDQLSRQPLIRRQVQVGEENLVAAQRPPLRAAAAP